MSKFYYYEKKIEKKRFGLRVIVFKSPKKAEICVFFAAGLSKVISMKNKKMPNVISFILIINFISKNKPPTQNLTKSA